MIDGHIHIERGNYSIEWIEQFVNKAVKMKIDEIWLLEHCYIIVIYLKSLCLCMIQYAHTVNMWIIGFKEVQESIRCRSIMNLSKK